MAETLLGGHAPRARNVPLVRQGSPTSAHTAARPRHRGRPAERL